MSNVLAIVQQQWIDFADACDVFIRSHSLFLFCFFVNTTLRNTSLSPAILSSKAESRKQFIIVLLYAMCSNFNLLSHELTIFSRDTELMTAWRVKVR